MMPPPLPSPSPDSAAATAPRRALVVRNPEFRRIWIGQVLSQSGSRMYQIALVWWLLKHVEHGAGLSIGAFMVLGALPSILFFKQIGQRLERWPSKQVMVVAELAAAAVIAVLGALLAFDRLTPLFVYCTAPFVALAQAFVDPALAKSVPELVPPEDVEGAVAYETSTQSLANFAGAAFGAAFVGALGFLGTIGLNVASYLASAAFASRARFTPPLVGPTDPATLPGAPPAAALTGWAVLDGLPLVKRVLIAFGMINFFATPTFVVLPLYVNRTLGGDASTLGALEAALWVGLLIGAFAGKLVPADANIVKVGAGALAVFGLCLGVPGVLTSAPAYGAALLVGGVAVGLNNVKFVALFQETVPNERKGRFFALMQAALGFTFPVAFLAFGAVGDLVAPPTLCLIQAGGVLLLSLYVLSLANFDDRGFRSIV